jgi:hypothetical protein
LFTCILSGFCRLAASPTSVGFMARAACTWWMPRSPKTSLIADAKTSSPTDGFTLKDKRVLYGFGRVKRVGAGAMSAPLPGRVTGAIRVKSPLTREERQRLESFCAVRGMSCLRPLNPPAAGHPSRARNNPKTLAWTGGRADAGFPARVRKPLSARLIRPMEFGSSPHTNSLFPPRTPSTPSPGYGF